MRAGGPGPGNPGRPGRSSRIPSTPPSPAVSLVKILCITTKSPWPLFEGRALRSYNLIRQAAREHEVHLLSFVQTQEDADGIGHMRSICPVVEAHRLHFGWRRWELLLDALREPFTHRPLQILKYECATMRRRVAELVAEHRYDLVHLDMLHLAGYMDVVDEVGGVPVVLAQHNVETTILKRRAENDANPLRRAYLRYQHAKLARYEARACRRAARVVAVSDVDAAELERMSGRRDIAVVPNGVDTGYFDLPRVQPDSTRLVFVGAFTWFPNQDAVAYFCERILPLVRAEVPDARLSVVGRQPDTAAVRRLAALPGVELTGLLDDIRPTVADAAVYVVPLRIGGGTRLKILDALSMSKAIVSTSVGCEGLEVTHGQDILVADEPEAFAASIVALLRRPQEAAELGRRGRETAVSRYDWSRVAQGLMVVYRQAAEVARLPQRKAARARARLGRAVAGIGAAMGLAGAAMVLMADA